MRRTLAFMTVTIMLAGSPLWAQQPPAGPALGAPPSLIIRQVIPGKSIAGIDLGSRVSLVLSRFGRASEVRETSLDTVYLFSRFGIAVYAQKGVVSAVSTSNSLMKIGDDVGPGSRVEDVTAMLGTNSRHGTVEAFPGTVYDERGVAFGLDGKAVALVMIFRPATAGQVSGLSGGGLGPSPQVPVAGFPNVGTLQSFGPETSFMSLPGYLRWLVNQTSGNWLTFAEATRIIDEQRISR